MHPASPAHSRSQRGIFSGVAVRAGIRMSARHDGPRGLPIIHDAISLHFGFDNSHKNKLRVMEIFCWTLTAFFDTLATQSGEISRKIRLMKICALIAVGAVFMILTQHTGATQADDTTITITGHTAGAKPFISKLTLEVSNTTVLKSIQFAIDSKPGLVTRPLSGTYSNNFLASRAYVHPPEIILPVYGLYAGYQNIVRLTYRFLDGSSKQAVTSITTSTFDDQGCGYNSPTKLQPRTNSTQLSYDYFFDRSACGDYSPIILIPMEHCAGLAR